MRLPLLLTAVILAGCASGSGSTTPAQSPSTPPTSAAPATLPAALLPGEKWVLVGSTVTPDPVGFGVTLRFEAGTVSGKGPVNRYTGQVTIGQTSFSAPAVASTKMAGPQDAMAAEQAYFAALGAARTWEVVDDTLTLSGETEPLLVYAATGTPAAFAVTLVGLPLQQAKQKISGRGYTARVVSVDGDVRPVTMDYRPDRINLTVVDGSVTQATQG